MNIPDVFRSKRFWTGLIGLVFMVAVEFFPELAENSDLLIDSTLVVVGLLIGGYTAVDVAQAIRTGKTKYDRAAPVEDASATPIKQHDITVD